MKAEPTDIDKEAAALFKPAPGMRAIMSDSLFGGRWVRIAVADKKLAGCYETGVDTWDAYGKDWWDIDALDTDDPATVGAMLAQVGEHGSSTWLQPLWRVSIPADAPYHGETMATVTGRVWSVMTSTGSAGDGPTEGAALVAAMRALKSTPTR